MVISWGTIPVIWILPSYASRIGGWLSGEVSLVWGWQSDVALAFSIIISLLLTFQGIAALKGRSPAQLGFIIFIIVFGYDYLMSFQWMAIHLLILVVWIVHCIALITFGICSDSYGPTSKERQLFEKTARHIAQIALEMQAPGRGEVNKEDVEEICRELYWIEASAWRVGSEVDIHDVIKSGREALLNLEARCSISDTIRIDDTISFDKLRAFSDLPTERFDTFLLDMCRLHDLSPDGNAFAAKNDRDATEACIGVITRRRVIIKYAIMAIVWGMILLIWIFPIGTYRDYDQSTTAMIWAWGWRSGAEGWFEPYPNVISYFACACCYAAFVSLLLAYLGIVVRSGRGPGSLGIFLGIIFMIFGLYCIFSGFVGFRVIPVLGIVNGVISIVLIESFRLYGSTSQEKLIFQKTAQHILINAWKILKAWKMQKSGIGEVNRREVDEICRELYWIETFAWQAGADVQTELEFGREVLSNLDARCSISDAIRTDGAISFDKLCTFSGLPTGRFTPLLLDMCRQLDLSTDGSMVTTKNDQDAIDLLQEIEGYFGRWREVEASKLGKV